MVRPQGLTETREGSTTCEDRVVQGAARGSQMARAVGKFPWHVGGKVAAEPCAGTLAATKVAREFILVGGVYVSVTFRSCYSNLGHPPASQVTLSL